MPSDDRLDVWQTGQIVLATTAASHLQATCPIPPGWPNSLTCMFRFAPNYALPVCAHRFHAIARHVERCVRTLCQAGGRALAIFAVSIAAVTATGFSVEAAEPADTKSAAGQQTVADRQQQLVQKIQPFLKTYCIDCHGLESQDAGIVVSELKSVDQFLSERKTWERVYRMISVGAMPPSDHDPLPSAEERQKVSELLHDELFNFDCDLVYKPGRPTVQRLNRSEFNNTIRDLFGVSITPADDFPADDVGEGFDNNGDVLSLPPLLMEKYLNAAEQVADAVIDSTDYSKPQTIPLGVDQLTTSNGRKPSGTLLWLPSSGEIFGTFEVPAAGEYELRITAQATQMGDEKAKFGLSVDGKRQREFEVIEHAKNEVFKQPLKLDSQQVKIGAAFLNDAYDPKNKQDRNFAVAKMELHGPIGAAVPFRSDAFRRLVVAQPGPDVSVKQAAEKVLRPLLDRAFRRPCTDAEVSGYVGLVQHAVADLGETYEGGLSLSLQAILVAPEFLFRLEEDPPAGTPERTLNDFEVASRLSYFLWSSMPDDELFELARQKKLTTADTLRQQVRRMLKDDKADALVQNFAAQWLNLRNIDDVTPNPDVFKNFDSKLKHDMRRETELLFGSILQEDRSVEELLSADYTFLNKRLADHYGIEGVKSDNFERISLKGTNRTGVLTHASILTLTSNPGRTSPVKRGKWIMENMWGEAPPPPPPNVPELEATAEAAPNATLREQLAKHREDPGCASCHVVMDPLGLGLENFDAIGRWRDKDGDHTVDASGQLPSGESFNGPIELIAIIQKRREKFFRTLAEKLLVYALGRGTEFYDKCVIEDCVADMAANGNRFSALIESLVLSDSFLKRSGLDTATKG